MFTKVHGNFEGKKRKLDRLTWRPEESFTEGNGRLTDIPRRFTETFTEDNGSRLDVHGDSQKISPTKAKDSPTYTEVHENFYGYNGKIV